MRRFNTLDGMRGVAALIVAIGHGQAWFNPIPGSHSWLAVDFFFVISGFVLAKVYEPRFRSGLAPMSFMAQRYIRLYPLYFLGIGLGIISGIIALLSGHGGLSPTGFLAAAVSGILLVPSPIFEINSSLVPLNTPGWSLVLELIVNFFYAIFIRFLSSIILLFIVSISTFCLIYNYQHGLILGGTSIPLFWAGLPRVGYSFFGGVLIARHLPERSIKTQWSWLAVASLVPLLFWAAKIAPAADTIIELLAMPLLVAIGASIEPPRPRFMATLRSYIVPDLRRARSNLYSG